MILMPIVVSVLCLRTEIVSVAFARGVFDASAVGATSSLLGCYCLGLLFMSFRETLTKVFYSMQDMKTPAKNATIGVLLNVGLNLTLPFVLGVEGLALGTSFTAMFISLRLLYLLKNKHDQIQLIFFQKNLIGIIASTTIMAIVIVAFLYLYKENNNIIRLVIGATVCIVSYLLSIWLFRVPVFRHAKNMIFGR